MRRVVHANFITHLGNSAVIRWRIFGTRSSPPSEHSELEARRLAGVAGEGAGASSARKQIVNEVGGLRQAGEMKSYIDLLFLALIVLLCVSKIVTD